MTELELKKAESDLKDMILKCARDKKLGNENIVPVCDGIYDAKMYLNSGVKIMWVLNEPNLKYNPHYIQTEKIWHLNKCMFDEPVIKIFPHNDIRTIAHISYGILNNVRWKNIPQMAASNDIANSLQEIAIINISKMPHSSKDRTSIDTKYKYWKEVLLKQIDTYNPDVIIFGNNYRLFKDDLPLSKESIATTSYYMNMFEYGRRRLLINTYNPSKIFTREEKEEYADGLIVGINDWLNKRNNIAKARMKKFYACILRIVAS